MAIRLVRVMQVSTYALSTYRKWSAQAGTAEGVKDGSPVGPRRVVARFTTACPRTAARLQKES